MSRPVEHFWNGMESQGTVSLYFAFTIRTRNQALQINHVNTTRWRNRFWNSR